jgi:peptidyl-prolyl cis-trans isomerase SurA
MIVRAQLRWRRSRDGVFLVAALVSALSVAIQAQQTVSSGATSMAPNTPASQNSSGDRVTLDSVAAVVNGELVLESDVDAERRFRAFQPFSEPQPASRDRLMERLIDRTLILQQMALQPQTPVEDSEVDTQLAALRKAIPQCAAAHCETDAGWKKFVESHGFTVEEVRERWRQRMEVLRYIEERFRMGITITQAQIDAYYQQTMLPAYEKEKVTPPAEASVSDRVSEILLQQQVDKLLDDWLKALRAQGSVVVINPGEEAP